MNKREAAVRRWFRNEGLMRNGSFLKEKRKKKNQMFTPGDQAVGGTERTV